MTDETERLVVVTGGPGAGKTALITELAARGVATAPEAGRTVIRAQSANGGAGLPWADRALFAELMFAADLTSYEVALARPGLVVFDRGILDIIGYLQLCGLAVPAMFEAAARRLRYRREVFIAPPWREIFETDAERRQDFAEAQRTHDALAATYREYGYDLAPLPFASVPERAAWLLDRIDAPVATEPSRSPRVDTPSPGHHKSGRACRPSRK